MQFEFGVFETLTGLDVEGGQPSEKIRPLFNHLLQDIWEKFVNDLSKFLTKLLIQLIEEGKLVAHYSETETFTCSRYFSSLTFVNKLFIVRKINVISSIIWG